MHKHRHANAVPAFNVDKWARPRKAVHTNRHMPTRKDATLMHCKAIAINKWTYFKITSTERANINYGSAAFLFPTAPNDVADGRSRHRSRGPLLRHRTWLVMGGCLATKFTFYRRPGNCSNHSRTCCRDGLPGYSPRQQ